MQVLTLPASGGLIQVRHHSLARQRFEKSSYHNFVLADQKVKRRYENKTTIQVLSEECVAKA